MDKNLQETITSLKSIIKTTQDQLTNLQKEEHPDLKLMAVTRENHHKAVETLQMLNDIKSAAAAAVTTATNNPQSNSKISFPENNHRLTRAEYREMLKHKK